MSVRAWLMAIGCWCGLAGSPVLAAGKEGPVRPEAMVVVPHAPSSWVGMDLKGPEYRRLFEATRALAESRDALADLLRQRMARDGAPESADQEVLLTLSGGLLSYDNNQVHPAPYAAPQWQDLAGKSLDRIRGTPDFEPGREDVRMLFRKRGKEWSAPELAMLSTKFLAGFHLKGCGVRFAWDDAAFRGQCTLTAGRGDRRYLMQHSGEGSTVTIPEFRQWKDYSSGFWPDWWAGPGERQDGWIESFSIAAGERRGWILKAVLRSEERPSGFRTPDKDLFAWIEHGRVLRGHAIVPGKLPGRGPEMLVSLDRWSVTDRNLEADFVLRSDASPTNRFHARERWIVKTALPEPDSGGFRGEYRAVREKPGPENPAETVLEERTGVFEGTLYRGYRGSFETCGVDGRRTGEVLAGVASVVPVPAVALPSVAVEDGLAPAALFTNALELSRQVAALDWALREYPLPLEEALRLVRDGRDDRFKHYPAGLAFFLKATRKAGAERDVPPAVRPHMHEALAALMGADAAGAAAYAERLAEVASAALADRKAEGRPAVGLDARLDPEFGPFGSCGRAACEQGVNALPKDRGAGVAEWAVLDDWTCHGFLMRCWSFETGPYLPELPVVPGIRPGGCELEFGKPVRLAHPDVGEHLWAWRARVDPVEGRVTIPRECLLLTKGALPRQRWSASDGAGVAEEALDFFYNVFVTWYGTTTLRSETRRRVWMAARINWDGRVWVNDRLVWRPARAHSPERPAVFPVDLEAGSNRVTVCCSARPVGDGNNGNFGALTYKYGELVFGSFTVWVAGSGEPRAPEAVAAARTRQEQADRAAESNRVARAIRGRRGDGSGVYAEARPPVAWDIERGINVRWKRALPTDDAEPVVTGGKVFVSTYDGELACLDAGTGEELWRKKPETRSGAASALYPPLAVTASFALQAKMWRHGVAETLKPHEAYARSCLTPLADSGRAWMHDPRGVVACFDHAGKQLWAQSVEAQVPRFAEGGYVKARILPPTHPAAIGPLLVAAVGQGLAAFDRETGRVAWRRAHVDYLGQFAVMEPVDGTGAGLVLLSSGEVLDAGTGETLIARCAPLMPDSACEPVVDGRIAWFHAGGSVVQFWRDAGGMPAAPSVAAQAGTLCSRLLWHSPVDIKKRQHDMNHHNCDTRTELRYFSRSSAYPPTPALWNGYLFEHLGEQMSIDHGPQQSMRLHVYDALTGQAVAQRYALQLNATHPVTSTVIAGGLVFCGDEGGHGKGDYPNFPKTPSYAIVTAEEQPRRLMRNQPGLATLSPPQFASDAMYLAGEDQVVCVGRPEGFGNRYTDYEVDALRDTFFALEIGDKPGPANDGKVARIEPASDLTLGAGVPVVPIESGKAVDRWLFVGPFAVGMRTDVFAGKGGAATVRPEEGQTVAYTGATGQVATVTWAPLGGSPELASASGRRMMTTCYLYTVLEAPAAGFYEVDYSKSLMRDLDVYLAGQRLARNCRIELQSGRYPLMARLAIGTCQGHERLGWQFRLLALTAREAEHGVRPIEPEALAGIPEGLRAPIAPLLLSSLPPRMLGAWPLKSPVEGNPFEKERERDPLATVIAEGMQWQVGGKPVAFRWLPAGAIETLDKRGTEDRLHFNVYVGGYCQFGAVEQLGLVPRRIFGGAGAGLFSAVLENPRDLCVQIQGDPKVRVWLSGQECIRDRTIRLKRGFYPFLMEYRAEDISEKPVLPFAFRAVADPDVEAQRWVARVRRNEAMLRAIAASGPKGAYAQEALDASARADR